jgi:pimeloyl-ACP methyl ester carboxylesterase
MQIVLIPGFWLDGASFGSVIPPLEDAGHRVHALTLPGKRPGDVEHAGIGLHDHVNAVVEFIDTLAESVLLVGHSGGGTIAWGAADARPDAIVRVVFVDAIPLPAGSCINDELPVVGDSIPLPDWDVFEPEDLTDLDESLREHFRAIALPEPVGVAHDPAQLSNPARFAVPVTVIACEFPAEMVHKAIAEKATWVAELSQLTSLDVRELPTGHWPQFTKPTELAAMISQTIA